MTLTIAQTLSLTPGIDGNGMSWTTASGASFLCLLESRTVDTEQDWTAGSTKYVFEDDSSIVTAGPAWDLGIDDADCHCWAGAGHVDGCEA